VSCPCDQRCGLGEPDLPDDPSWMDVLDTGEPAWDATLAADFPPLIPWADGLDPDCPATHYPVRAFWMGGHW
jgi:hypothetical protein